MALERSQML